MYLQQALSALIGAGLTPDLGTMQRVMVAYTVAGDVDGFKDLVRRTKEMGFIFEDTQIARGILTALLNVKSNDAENWDRINKHYNDNVLPKMQSIADYVTVLEAAERHGRLDVVYSWFTGYLNGESSGPYIKKTFKKLVGEKRYEEFIATLTPEQTKVLNFEQPPVDIPKSVRQQQKKGKVPVVSKTNKTTSSSVSTGIAVTSIDGAVDGAVSKVATKSKAVKVAKVKVVKEPSVPVPKSEEIPAIKFDRNAPHEKDTEEYLIKVKAEGRIPSMAAYNRVLANVSEAKNVEATQRIFDDMKASGHKGTFSIFRVMSQLYANNGDIANVDKMIVEATAADLKPGKIEIITFTLLVCLSVS